MQAALRSPRNTRFVLLSESCTPLYPPHLLYLQLLADQQSRVNACRDAAATTYERWVPAMYRPGLLGPESWRKSSQWKSLIREHAEVGRGRGWGWEKGRAHAGSQLNSWLLLPK